MYHHTLGSHLPSKKLYSILFLLVLLVLLVFSSELHAKSFRYVIIDPGHGGHDRGGNKGLVYEKHLALDTALRLEYYLKQRGVRVRMTRRSDYFVSLSGRASYGNKYNNSIFVSIHYSHCLLYTSPSPRDRG